jgi:uracil-DNA glycosylase family 4
LSWKDDIRNPNCTLCPLHSKAEHVCLMGSGPRKARVMVIGEAPGAREDESHVAFVGRSGQLLDSVLSQVGLPRDEVYVTNVAKCRPPDNRTPKRGEIKVCVEEYLTKEFEVVRPEFVLLLGNAPLQGVIGKSGITKHNGTVWRVEVADGHWARVFATVHPAAVLRNPRFTQVFAADITRFGNLVHDRDVSPKTDVRIVSKKRHMAWLLEQLMEAEEISWDVETDTKQVEGYVRSAGQYWHGDDSWICSIAFSWEEGSAAAVPLMHPSSPWKNPQAVLEALKPALTRPRSEVRYIAHNSPFDARWAHSKGVRIRQDFDTMLAAHMTDENQFKGLKPLSKTELGAAAYGVGEDIKHPSQAPIRKLCIYNGKDTDYTLRLAHILKERLKEDPRSALVFLRLMMPAANALVDVERLGVWVDPERWEDRYITSQENRDKVHQYINQFWPEDKPINLNSPPQVGRLLFEHLELPILLKTKTGAASTAEAVLLRLEDQHKAAKAIMIYRKWAKYVNTYLGPWKYEWMDSGGRIHSSYKLFGTVTGRLSGEGGIQQVPRDPFIRSIIGAPPGWKFVQGDFSQVEVRIAFWLADERRGLRQYLNNEDIHSIRAMRMTGKIRAEDLTKEERKRAKPVTFGYLYGMGATKFTSYAFDNYGVKVTQDEAESDRNLFFEDYPALRPWHDRQRKLARRYGRVVSPIGRVRHLPDISSDDEKIRQEAERQAINSPVQSFASDLMLIALVYLHSVLPPDEARIVGTVHDSILFEVRDDKVDEWVPFIKETMEDMKRVERLFGTEVGVPIVADMEVGQHWGEGTPWE